MNKKQTKKPTAKKAGSQLKSKKTTKSQKSVAASTLTQRKAPKKQTSKKVASKASKQLRSKSTTSKQKSVAASALSQTKK